MVNRPWVEGWEVGTSKKPAGLGGAGAEREAENVNAKEGPTRGGEARRKEKAGTALFLTPLKRG